jgi:peptidoglycan/xylan/chitin deacetylase (PgdA/CDA1 family)
MGIGYRFVAQGLAHAGLSGLIRAVRRTRRSVGRGLVLMYHRISMEPDYLGLCVSPRNFNCHLALLKRRAQVLPLCELAQRVSSSEPLQNDIAAITFDDGYRDNLDVALPILARHELPATVFITTDFIDGYRRPISERLQYAFESLWCSGVTPDSWDGIGNDRIDRLVRLVLMRPSSWALLRTLAFSLPQLQGGHAETLVERLEQRVGVPSMAPSRMLDWHKVRDLASSGVEIGSHTLSHPILSRIPRARAEHELLASKQRIEKILGQEVRAFAFPNGGPEDFTDADVEFLQRTGYAYACTAQPGVNLSGSNPYRLLRIGVGNYSAALFDLKITIGK